MFVSKSNSNQKRAKKTQEREIGNLPLNNSLGEFNYSLWRATASNRQATKNTRCGELGTTRQATKNTRCASDDFFSLREFEHSLWRGTTDMSANKPLFSLQNPNFDITSLH